MTKSELLKLRKGARIEYEGAGWHFIATVASSCDGTIEFKNFKPFKDQEKDHYREDGFRSYDSMTLLPYEPFKDSIETIKGKNKQCLTMSCIKRVR